ncbi:MAG: galactose-1-phosphate uridylyltransferase, partial [Crocosphaera sp.]|nr:galactose-1-phosphate uridylyltransferase [Crocosphaera sp.]
MENGQVRLNKATGEWVIYAPSRRKRPQDFQQQSQEYSLKDNYQKDCPFCPQNQKESEKILLEIKKPQQEIWQTRVVQNKFPALNFYENPRRNLEGIYMTMP